MYFAGSIMYCDILSASGLHCRIRVNFSWCSAQSTDMSICFLDSNVWETTVLGSYVSLKEFN